MFSFFKTPDERRSRISKSIAVEDYGEDFFRSVVETFEQKSICQEILNNPVLLLYYSLFYHNNKLTYDVYMTIGTSRKKLMAAGWRMGGVTITRCSLLGCCS